MRPQLDHCGSSRRKITKRREDTNLIRKNCKEIWEYISKREEAGKAWSVWFPIAMTQDRVRWILGTRKKSAPISAASLVPECETRHSSILVSQWREFCRRYYKGDLEHFNNNVISDTCKEHCKYVLDSGYPMYNERLVRIQETIGYDQSQMFPWSHDYRGGIYNDTLFDGKTASQVYESFMNAVMSDTLDHAL